MVITPFKGKFSSLLSIFNKVTNTDKTYRSLKKKSSYVIVSDEMVLVIKY